MLGNTIRNFTIGIGYQLDRRGQREAESSIRSLRDNALQLGAVVSGAFGLARLTSEFDETNLTLSRLSETFGISAQNAAALGRVLEFEGSTFNTALTTLERIERARAGILRGDVGFITTLATAGITDVSVITQAEDAFDALAALADQFAALSPAQRLNAADAFGFDEPTIRLLSLGTERFLEIIEAQNQARPFLQEYIEASQAAADATAQLNNELGQTSDLIQLIATQGIAELTNRLNTLLGFTGGATRSGLRTIADTPGASEAVVLGVAGAGARGAGAALASRFPIAGLGAGALGAAAGVGAAGSAGFIVGREFNERVIEQTVLGRQFQQGIGRQIAVGLALLGNQEAQQALQREERFGRGFPAQNLNITLELDGEVLDRRTLDVIEQNNQIALDDITDGF